MINGVRLNHWFFWSLLAVTLLVCGLVYGQASVPTFTATVSGPEFVPLYDEDNYATADLSDYRPWLVQVDATTDMKISIWGYGFGATGTAWGKLSPEWGHATGDTVLSIAAGESETYKFRDRVRPSGVYVFSGTGTIKGE